jgi:hypothetical protein
MGVIIIIIIIIPLPRGASIQGYLGKFDSLASGPLESLIH